MTRTPTLIHLFFISILFLMANQVSSKPLNDSVYVKVGKAKLTGKVTSINHKEFKDQYIRFFIAHPVTNEVVEQRIPISPEGSFSADIPLQTNQIRAVVTSSLNEDVLPFFMKLQNGLEHSLIIHYDAQVNLEKVTVKPEVSQIDISEGYNVYFEMSSMPPSREKEALYNKSHDFYLDYLKARLEDRLNVAKANSLISLEMKDFVSNEFKLQAYIMHFFDYENEMRGNFKYFNPNAMDTLVVNKVDRTYYRFLSQLKLNDNRYFLNVLFPEFQKRILDNEHLNLPAIGDEDIAEWIKETKSILADLVGFKDGLYYEILAANQYGRQLSEQKTPLSDKQITQINKFWKDSEIAKALLQKNEQIIPLAKLKVPAVVHDLSGVPAEKVMETIVSKYKDKVVLVDLWATWCAPCLSAMDEILPVKNTFRDNVVYVYLTNPSSPTKLWEQKLIGIGNEHYYLSGKQWEYIMEKYDFEYIPSYILFDKKGDMVEKYTAFPGNEEFIRQFTRLLK